jgi:hypothetical protein
VHPAPGRISLAKEMAGGYGEASSSGAASCSPVTVDDVPAVVDWEGRVHLHFSFSQLKTVMPMSLRYCSTVLQM